ncbi:hypothetical protein KI387_037744 [Taxus chinensis]|uniref:Reverse transcriptase domain-containing protein n=1 Tax=Taxus chinensis TaxID=29808 RepID=A0AA38FTT3_TAXCH|nr:hypothetical protein KI387_037744 [Taxus chinensis]
MALGDPVVLNSDLCNKEGDRDNSSDNTMAGNQMGARFFQDGISSRRLAQGDAVAVSSASASTAAAVAAATASTHTSTSILYLPQTVYFNDLRHDAFEAGTPSGPLESGLVSKWRMKDRMKTGCVALVLCLNIGVDPPDVIKISHVLGWSAGLVMNCIWEYGVITKVFNTAIFVSIPKKGDLTLHDNYSGISLINVMLKILTIVIIKIIEKELEERKFFLKSQVGLRKDEECIGKVAALHEIVMRCMMKLKKPMYAAFIDFKKAYDMVPHEALFRKVRAAGVGGRPSTSFKSCTMAP